MNADNWLNQASYSLEIGNDETKGSVDQVLAKRAKILFKGGHLLRTLDVIKPKGSEKDTLWAFFVTEGK